MNFVQLLRRFQIKDDSISPHPTLAAGWGEILTEHTQQGSFPGLFQCNSL